MMMSDPNQDPSLNKVPSSSHNSKIEFDIVDDLETIPIEKKVKRSYNKKKI